MGKWKRDKNNRKLFIWKINTETDIEFDILHVSIRNLMSYIGTSGIYYIEIQNIASFQVRIKHWKLHDNSILNQYLVIMAKIIAYIWDILRSISF